MFEKPSSDHDLELITQTVVHSKVAEGGPDFTQVD
jgi:hypothetical protein